MSRIICRLGTPALAAGVTLALLSGMAAASSGDERGAGDGLRFGAVVVERPPYNEKAAEASFRRYDKSGVGKLTPDKMPNWLKDEWERWDKNLDGLIDLAEYKEAYKAHMTFLRGKSK